MLTVFSNSPHDIFFKKNASFLSIIIVLSSFYPGKAGIVPGIRMVMDGEYGSPV